MRRYLSLFVVGAISLGGVLGGAETAGGAGYDFSNPSSTNCMKKGKVEYAASVRVTDVWKARLRRSTGCNTVWGVVNRTDTKKCQGGGKNCARVRITRQRADGVKTTTAWRKMPVGSKNVYSFQLDGQPGSAYWADFSTFGGKYLGSSGFLISDAQGNWSAA